jgi:hypothetical protein
MEKSRKKKKKKKKKGGKQISRPTTYHREVRPRLHFRECRCVFRDRRDAHPLRRQLQQALAVARLLKGRRHACSFFSLATK